MSLQPVVTTTGDDGRSSVLPAVQSDTERADTPRQRRLEVLWEVAVPVGRDAMGAVPDGRPGAHGPTNSARFVNLTLPARDPDGDASKLDVPMHRTDTLDLIHVALGTVQLVLDDGTVDLVGGDHVVIRGDTHGWRNTGNTPATIVGVTLELTA